MRRETALELVVFSLLAALVIAVRVLQPPSGIAVMTGAFLFAGWFMKRRSLAFALPMVALLVSDAVLGFYDLPVMAAVYVAAFLPVVLGRTVFRKRAVVRVGSYSLMTSVFTLVFVNFFVWLTWYERSTAGLIECYVGALAMFKYRFVGDLFSTGLIFGAYAVAKRLGTLRVAHLSSTARETVRVNRG